MKLSCFYSFSILAFSVAASPATILWTGGGATDDFYDAANWDFGGSASSSVSSPTDDAMMIAGATVDEPSGSFTNIEIGDGLSVTLDNATFRFTNNNGFSGVDDPGDLVSTLSLTNGSSYNAQFATEGIEVLVDGTSSLEFRGAGDPINSQTERTRIILEPGAQLTLASADEFTEQGADIFVGGTSFAEDPAILTIAGTTGTANIPEPSATLLVALGTLGLFGRRRK